MNKLFARTVPVLIRSHLRGSLHALGTDTTPFKVLPHDLDLNLHLNNGRYLQLADLGRLGWLMRTGIAPLALRNGWNGVLGGVSIQFRRELKLWDRGEVASRLLGWDERWFYLEHRFRTAEGRPVAIAMARAAFRKSGSWIAPDTVRIAIGADFPAPSLPPAAASWRELELVIGKSMQSIAGI